MSRTKEEYDGIIRFVKKYPGEKMGDVAMRLDAELEALRPTHSEVFAAFTKQHTEIATLRAQLAEAVGALRVLVEDLALHQGYLGDPWAMTKARTTLSRLAAKETK
jgi:hypothetical protein